MILVLLGAIRKLWPLNFGQGLIFLTCIEIADVTCEGILALWSHHLLLCKPFLKIASMLLSTRTSIHITYFLGAAWLHKSVWLELSRSRLQRTLRCLNSLRRVLRLLILLLILWVSYPSIWHLLLTGHVYLIILLRHLWLIVHLWVTLMHHTLTSSLQSADGLLYVIWYFLLRIVLELSRLYRLWLLLIRITLNEYRLRIGATTLLVHFD